MIEINRNERYINKFESIDELLNYITTKPRKPGRNNSSNEEDYGFYKTKNFNEAVELLRHGDDELFKKISNEKSKIKIETLLGNARNRQQYFNDVSGFMPNVANYMTGNPKNMINVRKNGISQKVVNIFLNIRVPGGVSADEVIRIGSKYISIIDLLEKNGYRCNLYSGVANQNSAGTKHCVMMVRVKSDREPLNIRKLSFALAHPSMQRRIKFKWMEVNDYDYDFTNGYGQKENEYYLNEMLNKEFKDNFIVWNYELNNRAITIEEITKDLKNKFNINIEL